MSAPHLLLLAGTAEARALAEELAGWPLRLTVSLAGVTRRPAPLPGRPRIGGFGGAAGLAAWIAAHDVTLVVDATHPYAARISANAALAARESGCPLLRLERAEWVPDEYDIWINFNSLTDALHALPQASRPLLTTGSGTRVAFGLRPDLRITLRAIEPVPDLPPNWVEIRARPPFSEAEERALMEARSITHLITRNSGGAGRARCDAARGLGLPVFMLRRPAPPAGVETVADLPAALERIAARLGGVSE
ncbi:MAG: precorrin-6A/cobalt-precorrin-6A reductase [Tropicimonas sp.]|uniref:precorrin-6A/cobalt-precorrin-6A reductase n=1 Tax=Tropicimonas sp. TaxID=2067044 RepID=UPI003A83A9BF